MTPPTPPLRSAADRGEARARALAARRTRAETKAQVRAGYLSFSQVIDMAFTDSERGRAVGRMTVGELLLAIPGVGPTTADRRLVELGINGDRRIRALGERQRAQLVAVFW